MKKALILSTALVLLASPAMATGWKPSNKAESEAYAEAVAAAVAAQTQEQKQSQKSDIQNTVEGDDIDQKYFSVNTPSSAGNNTWECSVSYNGAVDILAGGLSIGVPQSVELCELLKAREDARKSGDPVEIAMVAQWFRDYVQSKIGYKATKLAIKGSAEPGRQVVHRAKPAWCDRVKASSTQSDRKACGLD